MSMGGPVDLDMKSLDVVMSWYDVEDKKEMSNYIIRIYRKILSETRKNKDGVANG